MLTNIILTVVLLLYGYINIIFENKLSSPFVAIVLIYVIWKLYDINKNIKEQNKKLEEIKELFEKSSKESDENTD